MALPPHLTRDQAECIIEARQDAFGYEPPSEGEPPCSEWYLNFADPDLFCAYGGPLFAQDEMQVAEHAALASLREALLDSGVEPLTVENGQPTPIVITGVQRRCAVATDPNPAEGRPHGLYGNNFARASPEAISRATTPITPPTITNIIAMAAPTGGSGAYTRDEIRYILQTAYTGFSAARIESRRERGEDVRVVVHTGFWGCGAFGGNRVLMAALQLLTAHLSNVNRLIFHTFDESGSAAFAQPREMVQHDLIRTGRQPKTSQLVGLLHSKRFRWGVSDGN
jgi:hypothetical protein